MPPFRSPEDLTQFISTKDSVLHREVGVVIDLAYDEYSELTFFVSYQIETRRALLEDYRSIPTNMPQVYAYDHKTDILQKLKISGYPDSGLCIMALDVCLDSVNPLPTCFLYFSNNRLPRTNISMFRHTYKNDYIFWVKDYTHDLITDPRGIAVVSLFNILIVNSNEDRRMPNRGTIILAKMNGRSKVEAKLVQSGLYSPTTIGFDKLKLKAYVNGTGIFNKKTIGIYDLNREAKKLTFDRTAHVGLIPEGISVDQDNGAVIISGAPSYFEFLRFKKRFASFPDALCRIKVVILKLKGHTNEIQTVCTQDGLMMSGLTKSVLLPNNEKLMMTSNMCTGLYVLISPDGFDRTDDLPRNKAAAPPIHEDDLPGNAEEL